MGSAFGQAVNSGTPKYLFPHHVAYNAGAALVNPSLTNSGTQAGMDSAVSQMYNTWYTNAVVSATGTCSGCLRVTRGSANGNDTVSEGIGYGMLFAAEMADQTLMNGLYNYYNNFKDNNNLMNWTCPGGSGCNNNSATDADEDMAEALLLADAQWGSAGTVNYKNAFQLIANGIYNSEIANTSDYAVYSGDAYQTPYYSSYMEPAWYRCWAAHDSQASTHNWTNVINWVYNNYFSSFNTTGFMPDTASANGSNASAATCCMGYDASRYPIRVGLDYLWNGNASAKTYVGKMGGTIATAITGGTSMGNEVEESWNITSGAPGGSNVSGLQVPGALVAEMVDANQGNVDSLWNMILPGSGHGFESTGFQYFQDSLCLWGALIGSNNFQDFVCGVNPCGTPTCTPTFTPVPQTCFMLSDLESGTPLNSTDGFWYTYGYASVNNTQVVTPSLWGVSPPSYIVDGTTSGQGSVANSYYAARVTGWYGSNGATVTGVVIPPGTGTATTVVYAGFALATEMGPASQTSSYQNLTAPDYMSQISFYVKTNQSAGTTETLRLVFHNPHIDITGSGNGDQYGYNFPVTATNAAGTWQQVIVPRSSILCGNWGNYAGTTIAMCPPIIPAPTTNTPSGGTTYTLNTALSDVDALQWQCENAAQDLRLLASGLTKFVSPMSTRLKPKPLLLFRPLPHLLPRLLSILPPREIRAHLLVLLLSRLLKHREPPIPTPRRQRLVVLRLRL